MDATPNREGSAFTRLRRIGLASWSLLGIIALTIAIAGGISALSGIIVPLLIAVILGVVLEPVVDWLVRRGLSQTLAAVIGLLLTILLGVGLVILVVRGFIAQVPEITEQIMLGWQYVLDWVKSFDLDTSLLERWRSALSDVAPQAGLGLLGFLTNTVYGAISLAIGLFFALFFLFFVLRDGHAFPGWLARTTGWDIADTTLVDTQVRNSLRGYFKGTAVTALITAPIFVIPLLVLKIPLVVPIMILYFFLSFVPFLGAWITGAFAVLIAFGAGGPTAALIVALSLLISNGTVQSVVSSWALGSALRLHPVAVLLATLTGGVVAGLLGMVLGAPLLAATQSVVSALRSRSRQTGRRDNEVS